jgi:hypothetical protein
MTSRRCDEGLVEGLEGAGFGLDCPPLISPHAGPQVADDVVLHAPELALAQVERLGGQLEDLSSPWRRRRPSRRRASSRTLDAGDGELLVVASGGPARGTGRRTRAASWKRLYGEHGRRIYFFRERRCMMIGGREEQVREEVAEDDRGLWRCWKRVKP